MLQHGRRLWITSSGVRAAHARLPRAPTLTPVAIPITLTHISADDEGMCQDSVPKLGHQEERDCGYGSEHHDCDDVARTGDAHPCRQRDADRHGTVDLVSHSTPRRRTRQRRLGARHDRRRSVAAVVTLDQDADRAMRAA